MGGLIRDPRSCASSVLAKSGLFEPEIPAQGRGNSATLGALRQNQEQVGIFLLSVEKNQRRMHIFNLLIHGRFDEIEEPLAGVALHLLTGLEFAKSIMYVKGIFTFTD